MKNRALGEPSPSTTPAEVSESRGRGFAAAWTRFWFTPADATALHAVRVLSGLLFLFWLLPFAGSVEQFFSFDGLFDKQAYLEMSREMGRLPPDQRPHVGWSVLHLVGDSAGLVQAAYWGTIVVLVLFTLGIAPRVTSVLTYVMIASFVHFLDAPLGMGRSSEESLLVILAFCLMIGYVLLGQFGRDLTLRQRILGTWDSALPFIARLGWTEDNGARRSRGGVPASYAANLVLRLFQVNFALMLVVSFFHKLQIGDWWSGVAFWYPLHPPFETKPADIHAAAPYAMSLLFIYSLAQYLCLAWQLTFPLWAWRRNRFCRTLLIGGGIIGFLGCMWIYQAPATAGFVLVGCLAFLTADEWRRFGAVLEKFWQKDNSIAHHRGEESRTPVAAKA
jgi:hypothetical protein